MATFTYEALNSVGQPVKGEVDATSSEDAISKVRAMGNFPTKIKEKAGRAGAARAAPAAGARGGAQARAPQRRTVGAVSKKLLTQFTRQLSTLVDAGLPLLRSLRILEAQQKPGMLRVAIRLVADDVEGGATLSEAMAKHPKAFDRLYSNMVRAGELGGVLDLILQRLADFMEKSQALKRKVISAMIYPIAVITFAVLILVLLMIFVVPKFKDIYAGMGAKLPGLTQGLLDTSEAIAGGWWIAVVALPIGIWMGFRLLSQSDGGRYFVDSIKLKIPIFGNIVSKTSVARFSRTLGTLLSAGVPILEALTITRETSGNEVFGRAMGKVYEGIREGESFADPLRQAKIVEPMVVNMIDVGEETGELDKMLTKVADNYDEEVETLVAGMTSLLEPAMVITLGVIVGTIVLALFLPMPRMLDIIQGSK
ncbi:MAG TPA: pilus assembly protein PilC [Phycisphaerales bacterium]|nr:pilus assembly protein PilC [Phycisphaerales bacterium]